MATVNNWSAPAATTLLTTEMDNKATGTYTAASAAYDNSTNRYMYADVELLMTWAAAPSAGGTYVVLLQAAPDGTNYETGSLIAHTNQILCTVPLDATNATQRLTVRNVLIPPTKFKVQGYNNAGQTTANPASGSLKLFAYATANT